VRLTCKKYYKDIKCRRAWNAQFIKTEKSETAREVALFYDDDILLKQILCGLPNGETLSLKSHLIAGPCKKCISLFYDRKAFNKILFTEDFFQYILCYAVENGNSDLFSLCVYRSVSCDYKYEFYNFLIKSKKHPKFLEILLKTTRFDYFWTSEYKFDSPEYQTPFNFFLRLGYYDHVKLLLDHKKELCQNPHGKLNLCNGDMFELIFNYYFLDTSKFTANDFRNNIFYSDCSENIELVLIHYPEIINIVGAPSLFSKIIKNVFSNSTTTLSGIKTLFQICDAKDLIQKCADHESIEKLVYCICYNNDREFMKELIDKDVFKCVTSWNPDSKCIFNDVYRMFVLNVLNL
jgi:hypothetical protein